VAAVGLDQVGWGLGGERSRVARASQDWHQRSETGARCGPWSADVDGMDDPPPAKDRGFLGLQGPRSAAEGQRITPRLEPGTRQQARRGARRCGRPIGAVREASGAMAWAPEAPVPQVVRRMVRQVAARGPRHALGRERAQQGSARGVRRRAGPAKGPLAGRCPKRTPWQALRRHPLSAGASASGRRHVDGRRTQPGRPRSGRVDRTPHTSQVWRTEAVPAYRTWEHSAQHVARCGAKRAHADTREAVRRGPSLVSG